VDVIDSNALQWYRPAAGHREEGVEFKTLFTGVEGAADNYWFTLVQVREHYHTPPHRHMFDQVRVMLTGGFNFGTQNQAEGTIGYFTEGTEYEQRCDSYSYHLLLQCEGASRTPYFSGKSMRAATDELKQEGVFEGGQYRRAGSDETLDGYEAIYERLTSVRPRYKAPRYERPVIMDPSVFDWTETGTQGVRHRNLGIFNERQLELANLAITAGSTATLAPAAAGRLLFATAGRGEAQGAEWRDGSAIRIDAGEAAEISAHDDGEFLVIKLPNP
jgi:hypothetical protein